MPKAPPSDVTEIEDWDRTTPWLLKRGKYQATYSKKDGSASAQVQLAKDKMGTADVAQIVKRQIETAVLMPSWKDVTKPSSRRTEP